MTRPLTLCADDYGMAPAVDRGILRLAARRRLSEVSCLVNAPGWAAAAPALALLRRDVRAGLHLNLTEGRPLSATLARVWPRLPPLQQLITLAHLRRLPAAAIGDELRAQWHAFERAYGRPPRHVDGHQHVHHLPQVREQLLELLATRPGATVRHTGRVLGPGYVVKRLLIEGTGGRALGRRLEALGRASNTHLLGVYDFQASDYRRLMQGWLRALPARGGLLFCHPGEAQDAPGDDAIAAARVRELNYLDSADFDADLRAAEVQLT